MTRPTRLSEEGLKEWRPVRGLEALYEVSNLGRVRSLRFVNKVANKPRSSPLILSPIIKSGYLTVCLKRKTTLIHRMVLEAFKGPCPADLEAAHLDGNRKNNQLDNLQWTTKKENHSHKKLHGTAQVGMKNGSSTLTDAQVLAIRYDFSLGLKQVQIAKKHGLSFGHIHALVRRKSWKHL